MCSECVRVAGRVLRDAALPAEVRVCCLRCLAAAALREDVSLVLHQDRRHHALLNYAHDVDRHSPPEQYALALFVRIPRCTLLPRYFTLCVLQH